MATRHRTSPRPIRRITGPAELLQAIPYLLGFHPQRSLVLVGLHASELVVTARLDLADVAEAGVLAHTIAAMARGGSSAVVAVAYDDSAGRGGARGSWAHLHEAVQADADDAGCDVLDTLLVAGGRWWSLTCRAPDCCPPGGQELPSAPSEFAAAATYAGVVALPDRAALAATLDPATGGVGPSLRAAIADREHEAVRAALEGEVARYERSVKRAIFAAARASERASWPGVGDPAELARFGVPLRGIGVRDAVWMAVDDGRLDGRPLWRDLARRLPAPYDAAALFLFGWAAWRCGDGALAGIAAERAVTSDPAYSAADLLLAALSQGVDPRRLPRLRLPRSA